MMRKKNVNKIDYKKICITIGLSIVLIFVILFNTELNPIRLLGSLYNVDDVETSIGKIKVGDIIHYDINGYSDWQVVSIDKNNNTLDVVSKTNVEDVTLTTKEDYENALDIFQQTADKYTDNKYAIKARCVTRADLENFAFDEIFWNADIYNGAVAFTNGAIRYGGSDNPEEAYYLLPLVQYNTYNNYGAYTIGDEIELNIAGIDKWIFVNQPYSWSSTLWLVPKEPIALSLDDPNLMVDAETYIKQYFESIKNSDSNISMVVNYGDYYSMENLYYDAQLKNYYKNNGIKYTFYTGSFGNNQGDNYKETGASIYKLDYDAETSNCCDWKVYREPTPYTKGFRPIVTLKYSDKLVDGKALTTDLQIGDNVKYSANEYNNWRVLSIDEENNTVDIISGGVVKNLKLYGSEDFENYEDILQSEVDAYKVGDKVISARIVQYEDMANLNKMNDDVNVKYWTYEKKDYNKKANDDTSSPYATNAYYDGSIMYYNIEDKTVTRKWVSLYISSGLNSGSNTTLSDNGSGDLSFTAGIRPVITLKLDQVEKVDNNSGNGTSSEQEENIAKEQQNNSEKYVTNDETTTTNNYYTIINNRNNNDDNKKNNNNTEISNNQNDIEKDSSSNEESVNNYYSKNTNGKHSKWIKYIVIAIILLNIAIICQVVLSVFIIKNIKSNFSTKKSSSKRKK